MPVSPTASTWNPSSSSPDRLLWLATVPAGKPATADLDSFIDRVHAMASKEARS